MNLLQLISLQIAAKLLERAHIDDALRDQYRSEAEQLLNEVIAFEVAQRKET